MTTSDQTAVPAAPDSAAIAEMEQRILASPADAVLVADYMDLIGPGAEPDSVFLRLAEFQDRAGTPLPALLLRLDDRYKKTWVQDRFADLLKRAAEDESFRVCASLWQAHLDGRPLDRDACRDFRRLDRGRVATVYFRFIAPPITQIAMMSFTDKQKAILDQAEIQIDALKAGIERFLRFGSPEWEAVVTQARHRDAATAEQTIWLERLSSSKDRMVAERTLSFVDPLTGEWLEPYDGYVANGKAVYAFAGREPFYLIYAYLGLEPCGVYLPKRNLVLSLTHQARGVFKYEQMANIPAALLRRMTRSPDAYERASTMPPFKGPREVVLMVGRTENFAHHLWNFYAAIERLTIGGYTANVDHLLTAGTQFFGPMQALFPELKSARASHDSPDYQDPRPFTPESLVVPTGSSYVPISLSRRVIDTMRARENVTGALEPDDIPRTGPVVWFGMRLGDKSWVDQEIGIPRIAARIAERYPDALFLLDGFSFPVGEDRISGQWADVIAELNRIADVARAASPDPDRMLNLVGNTLRENVLWADATDVYLAPLGSTQHKVGWFTDAPGLVYAPPMYGNGKAERTVGNWAIEISAPITWLIGEPVAPGKRRGSRDTRVRMQNMAFDPDDLADRMLALMETRLAERGRWRVAEIGAPTSRRHREPPASSLPTSEVQATKRPRSVIERIRSLFGLRRR